MRIILVPSAYAPAVGGVEVLTQLLAHRLIATGHTVEVWTIRHPPQLPAVDAIDGITVRRFSLPLPVAEIGKAVRFGPDAVGALRDIGRATRAFSPDVLHVQCFSANGIYASAISLLLRIPLVVSLQGETVMDDHDIYERSMSLRVGLRAGLRVAHTVTACSQFVLNDAVYRFGLAPGTGVVVPNGVELRDAVPATELPLPFQRFVFALGRAVEKKGFDLLIEAFARIANQHADVGLVIGGDGAAWEGLVRRARELGMADRVALPGMLSRSQVVWAMHHAVLFVLPSRVEPFGIVVLEALEAGQPVVVSSRGGASEIVRDGNEGLVVDPLDPAALASAISRLLDDSSLRKRLSAAGRSRARDFAWETITDRYVALYREAVGRRQDPLAATAASRSPSR
jgi:glycogen(starch) synthase